MTYTPPPYSGPEATAAHPAWEPPLLAPHQASPPTSGRAVRPTAVVIAVLSVALVAATTMWLVTLSNNGALLDKYTALQADVSQQQAQRDAIPDLKAVAAASFGPSTYFRGNAEAVTVTIDDLNAEKAAPGLVKMMDTLGFSDAAVDRMSRTRALDGTQSAQGTHCNATWTYHPDDGLQIVFEADGT